MCSTKNIQIIGNALKAGKDSDLVELNKKINFNENIHFHKMEDLLFQTGGKLPPFRLFHYILAFFIDGKGTKTIGNHVFEIHPKQAIIIPKNIIHSTSGETNNIKGYVVSFHEDLFNQINLPLTFLELNKLFHYTRKPYKKVKSDVAHELICLFEEINTYKNANDGFSEKLLGIKLIELILQYHQLFDTINDHGNKTDYLFDQYVNLVETNFRNCRNIEWYAAKLNIDPSHLNKIVQKHTANSAKFFIQNRLFFEAKYLLTSTKATVKEIAYDLGFMDYNYFCRHFKNFVGITPSQFRNNQT